MYFAVFKITDKSKLDLVEISTKALTSLTCLATTMCTRKKRTGFTPEQKRELLAAFDGGLTSVNLRNTAAIEDLSRKIDCSTEVVKVRHMYSSTDS